MDTPSTLQRIDISRRDLDQRAVSVGALIVVAGRPAGLPMCLLCECEADGAGSCRNDDTGTQFRHECCHGCHRDRSGAEYTPTRVPNVPSVAPCSRESFEPVGHLRPVATLICELRAT